MSLFNETHDPSLRSWVLSANQNSDFPIQNLPLCIFRRKNSSEPLRAGIGIGEMVIDMQAVLAKKVFTGMAEKANQALVEQHLNRFMSMGHEISSALRLALSRALREGASEQKILQECLICQTDIEFSMPCHIGDYTDFYSSIYHATAVGKLFRPDQPLLPNYTWIPIAYHGRASSIGLSGEQLCRPFGQIKNTETGEPMVAPTKRLDYEVELGFIVGKNTSQSEGVCINQAEQHIFGVCLLNDWSARDVQAWEYQPLGPFLSKNFMTSISPWIVTLEALTPYRTELTRHQPDAKTLSYLDSNFNTHHGAFDIKLECFIRTKNMRASNQEFVKLSQSSFKHAFWTMAQMLTHHSLSGCELKSGDLMGSGTQSGPQPEEAGSLLELSNNGKQAITLPNGETRTFLEDGDEIELRGYCQNSNGPRIGLGSVKNVITPANLKSKYHERHEEKA